MTKTAAEARKLERELTIRVSPEEVWKAITDADELTRWFPLGAAVDPGPNGKIELNWGDVVRGNCSIRAWEPGRHLRMGWFETTEGANASELLEGDTAARKRLAVDWYLEGDRGNTVLRLVHSGFSGDTSWDDEFDGTRRGWIFELESLRTYLEYHRGKPRNPAWIRLPIGDMPAAEAWSKLMSRDALLATGTLDRVNVGERYELATVHGDRLTGTALNVQPPTEFSATVDEGQALFRTGIDGCFGQPEASVWLTTWNQPDRAARFRDRWVETLKSLFPGAEPIAF